MNSNRQSKSWIDYALANTLGINIMIKPIIKASLLFASFITLASLTQTVSALDLNLDHDDAYSYAQYPKYAQYPTSLTSELTNPEQLFILPQAFDSTNREKPLKREFSFELYHGDAYNDLRESQEREHGYILPEEDEDAYGFSLRTIF